MELASDTVKQMAEFLDKSIEKLGKQKEKGEKKLEKEKKKVEKAENQNIILQERITGKGVHRKMVVYFRMLSVSRTVYILGPGFFAPYTVYFLEPAINLQTRPHIFRYDRILFVEHSNDRARKSTSKNTYEK